MKLILINTLCFTGSWIIPRVIWDFFKIKNGEKINHELNAITSIAVVLSYAWLDKTLLFVPYLLFLYWLLFDLLLNKLRGKDLLYVGTTAWLDKSFRKIAPGNPGIVMLIVKIICLGISVWVFVYFNK